jgi:poly[(R)-3-hydroxyalkanoate] polymerase subunit PhaC
VSQSSRLTTVDLWVRFARAVFDTSSAPVGSTPKDAVWQRDRVTLYRYRPRATRLYPAPLLIVHSLISRPYIFDLVPGYSLVEYLCDEGFDVYLTDWGVPTADDARLRLEDYVLDYLPRMVDAVRYESQATAVSMLGYSLGGTLALLYAAAQSGSPVRNVISLGTPVDFDRVARPGIWGATVAGAPRADAAHWGWIDTQSNIPAEWMATFFRLLRMAIPGYDSTRYLGLWQNLEDDEYVAYFRALDRWLQDHIPFPGAAFRQVMKDLGQDNKLMRGDMTLGGRPVELRNIRQAFLAIVAESDQLVPLSASGVQLELVSSVDKQLLTLPGGHVGFLAGRDARMTPWPHISAWLAARSGISDAVSDPVGSGGSLNSAEAQPSPGRVARPSA